MVFGLDAKKVIDDCCRRLGGGTAQVLVLKTPAGYEEIVDFPVPHWFAAYISHKTARSRLGSEIFSCLKRFIYEPFGS